MWDDRPRIDKAGQNRRSDGWKEFEEYEQQSQEFNARMQRIDEKREAFQTGDKSRKRRD